jgi:hypothetical protein
MVFQEISLARGFILHSCIFLSDFLMEPLISDVRGATQFLLFKCSRRNATKTRSARSPFGTDSTSSKTRRGTFNEHPGRLRKLSGSRTPTRVPAVVFELTKDSSRLGEYRLVRDRRSSGAESGVIGGSKRSGPLTALPLLLSATLLLPLPYFL